MRRLLYVAAALAVAALIVPTFLMAQSTWRLPVPGPLTVGSIPYAVNANELGMLDAVAAGQVLVSQGTGTAPAWSSEVTIGAASLSNVLAISTSLSPTAITACAGGTDLLCATSQTFANIAGLGANDRVFVNGPPYPTYESGRCPMVAAGVTSANTLRLHFVRVTTGTCTPATGVYHIFAIRT